MNLAAKRAVVKTMFRKVSLVIFASSASSRVNQDERALNGAGQVKKKKTKSERRQHSRTRMVVI